MTFIDMFSGIGTIRMGMENAGHECIYSIENDKFKRLIYSIIFGGEPDGEDIRNCRGESLPRADIWSFGFPCKDISLAIQQNVGFKGKRSSLFFEVMRLLSEVKEEDKPSYLLIENVKELLFINRGFDFFKVLNSLDERGYDAEWQVLNTKNFSTRERPTPQNRERVFIIGHLRGRSTRQVFPVRENSTEIQIRYLGSTIGDSNTRRGTRDVVYGIDGLMACINASDWRQPKQILVKDKDGIDKIRKLTGKEYWRLQGISEDIIDKVISAGISDTQMYIGAGDGCTVNIIETIAYKLKED